MRETERRIQAYKAMLPRMKERVIAAVSLLAVALTSMVSATYAWLVLSQSPEVQGLQTTIAANGNLEIALATGQTITVPANSQVGDGALELVEKNITWGNLVNLGDPAYGLENIVLRPAQLNTNALLESPLYAAKYGDDGRVEMLDSDFAYAYWDQDTFSADPEKFRYGVRAISSVKYGQAPGQDLALAAAVSKAEQSTVAAQTNLRQLATHDALQDLVGLMGSYVQAQIDEKLGGSEPFIDVSPDQIESIYYLVGELKKNIELSAEALADIYNMEMLRRSDQAYVAENKFTGTYLLTETQANIQNKLKAKNASDEMVVQPSMVSYLWQLRTDYNTIVADLAVIETYRGRDDVKYRNLPDSNGVYSTYPTIETYVNHIADVGTCTINGTAIGKLSMSNISSLTGSGTKPIVIHKGIIQRMDKFTGAQIKSKSLTVSVKVMGMTNNATGQATTSATAPFVLPTEHENALSGDTSYKGTNPVAADTFGLALDFWVRTNATGSQLTLQGAPVYETREEVVTATIGGKIYSLYTVEKTLEGEKLTETAYFNDSDSAYYRYVPETGTAGECLGVAADFDSVSPLMETVTGIVGYNGINRVWEEDASAYLTDNSTTMGSGSCYVFYPQSPEDQEKSLQLLAHLKLAFVDQYGTLLGEAYMDTANVYEQPGKVTVPIVCSVTNSSTTDADGNPVYYITDLEANTPTLITTLVYLDGMNLTNDQVLAAADIQGHMNLQFGTTADITAMSDPTLMQEKCVVTASMDEPYVVSIDDSLADRTKTVTVRVEGYDPQSVVAYFQREINSTQGIRQGKMTFTSNGDGTWSASYPFTASGKYVLRDVILDGVTYDLDQEPLTFTVEGFTISDLYCEHNGKTFMLTDRQFTTSVSLTFSTDDVTKMPTSVKGAFIHKETKNRTTVHFTRDVGSTWVGTATFNTSGEYEMTYLELDGEYNGLAEDNYVNLNLYLGLSASVYTGDTNFGLESGETRDVPVTLVIRTDNDDIIGNLSNVWLQYANSNSGSQESGVGAGMVWNSTRNMYEGTFHLTESGVYNYHYVSIKLGDDLNYLNRAVVAPTITAISTVTPTYVSRDGFGDAFSLGSDAAFTLRMKNAGTATIDAKVTDANGTVYYVRGVRTDEGDEQVFTFTIPVVDGKQLGTWTLEGIYMNNVYGGANNTMFNAPLENGPDTATDSKPLYTVNEGYYDRWWAWSLDEITAEGDPEAVVTVADDLQIGFTASDLNASKVFGKDAEGNVTSPFGTTHTLGNLELQVLANGKPLSDYGMSLGKVEIKYQYDDATSFTKVNNSVSKNTYGDYTIATSDIGTLKAGSRGEIVYTLGSGTDGVYQLTTTNNTLALAGRYRATSISISVVTAKGEEIALPERAALVSAAPVYQVWSSRPTVEVSGVSSSHSSVRIYKKSNPANAGVDMFQDGANLTWSDWNKKNSADTATVYMYVGAKSGTFDQEPATLYQSKVSLKLSNISSNFTTATMTFAHNVASVGDFSAVYSFTPSGLTQSAGIGGYKQGSKSTFGVSTYPTLYPMGSKTVEELIVSYNGVTVTLAVNPITINNPLCPTTIHYVVQGEGSGYTVPDNVYPSDGTTVVLPGTQTWTSEGKRNEVSGGYTKADGSKTYTGYKDSRTVTETDRCGNTTTTSYYYPWTLVETKYESVGTIYSWTNTHKIVGWLVNGVEYDPGETVSVNGDTTITAVIETTKGAETSVEDVAVYYEWDFTQGSETTSKSGDDWNDLDTTDVIGNETNTTPFKDEW